MSFAAAEDRLNVSAMRVANASVSFAGGDPVDTIFDNEYANAGAGPLGMASTGPTLTMPTSTVPSSPQGTAVTVRGASYTVAEHHPDGAGWSLLLLEKA